MKYFIKKYGDLFNIMCRYKGENYSLTYSRNNYRVAREALHSGLSHLTDQVLVTKNHLDTHHDSSALALKIADLDDVE